MQTDAPFQYPRTYRRSPASKYLLIAVVLAFAVHTGVLTAALHSFRTSQGQFDAEHAILGLFFLTYVLLMMAIMSEQVIVYHDAIEVVSWFSQRKLMREEIRGYRKGRALNRTSTVYYVLIPMAQDEPPLRLPTWISFEQQVMHFLSDVPPLSGDEEYGGEWRQPANRRLRLALLGFGMMIFLPVALFGPKLPALWRVFHPVPLSTDTPAPPATETNASEPASHANDNAADARQLSRREADQSNPRVQSDLGRMYFEGRGVPKDYVQAATWFQKAAAQGDATAEGYLGWMYQHGEGVERSYAQARPWYRKAAEQGNASAQNSLGWMYYKGQGGPKDYAQALAWYRKAANQGNATAQVNLGWMYEHGEGIKTDYAEALRWYRKAAEQGNATAQEDLGVMYEKGEGVEQDRIQAQLWFDKAKASGYRQQP
jgi:Sel1 repeat